MVFSGRTADLDMVSYLLTLGVGVAEEPWVTALKANCMLTITALAMYRKI